MKAAGAKAATAAEKKYRGYKGWKTEVQTSRFFLLDWVRRAYRRFIICLTGLIFIFLLRVLNKTKVHNYKTLEKLMLERDEGVGLFTYSNHHSMLDDPGLPALFMPWHSMPWRKMRWNLCNTDMYFVHPVLTHIFRLGKGMPVSRFEGPEQRYMRDFTEKLNNKDWCHIFAEGKIVQPWRFERDEPHLGEFRIGPAKVLTHQDKAPICLPMYHIGMHNVYPERQLKPKKGQKKARGASTPISAIPRIGNQIDIFVGEPFSVEPWIERVKALGAQGVTWENDAAYKEIQEDLTNHLRERLLEVEAQARPYLYGGSGKGKKARKGRK